MLKKCLPLLLLCTAPVFAKPVLTVFYTYDSFAADWGPCWWVAKVPSDLYLN